MEETFTFEFDRNSVETKTITWSEHSNREKSHCKTKNTINPFPGEERERSGKLSFQGEEVYLPPPSFWEIFNQLSWKVA